MLTMNGKNNHINKIKERISNCRKRLDTLKDQGYVFSKDIYDDIASFETKIKHLTLPYRMWDNKRPMFVGIVGVLGIILIIFISITPNPTLNLNIDNLEDGRIILSNYTVTGTANHSENGNISVQVKINEGEWEIANGTTYWSYELSIDDLSEDEHTLFFKCVIDEKESEIIQRTILIQKENETTEMKPTVEIIYPEHNETVSDIININGIATAGTGEIKKVQLRFNGQDPWFNVSGINRWRFSWDTTTSKNGSVLIEVRSYDGENYSEIDQISVVVYNERNIIIPPFSEREYYQLYVPPTKLITPTQPYELCVYHRARNVFMMPRSSFPTYTYLEIQNKPDWLEITIQEKSFITHPNNKLDTISILFSISEDAPMNVEAPYTISYRTSIINLIKYPETIVFISANLLDSYVYTGQW